MKYGYGALVATTVAGVAIAAAALAFGHQPSPWQAVEASIDHLHQDGDLIVLADPNWRHRLQAFDGAAVATDRFDPAMLDYTRVFVVSVVGDPSPLDGLGEPLWRREHDALEVTLVQVTGRASEPMTDDALATLLDAGICDGEKGGCGLVTEPDDDGDDCVAVQAAPGGGTLILPPGRYAGWFKGDQDGRWDAQEGFVPFVLASDAPLSVPIAGRGCVRLHQL